MHAAESFVDIHCHLLPGLDDGARSWTESLEMARIAVDDGTHTVIATPHQLGTFGHVRGQQIRRASAELQEHFHSHGVELTVLPGADVRVQADLADQLRRGDVLTLGDHGKHVLLELPHELYFSLKPCLENLADIGVTGILSHPERNQGLLRNPELVGRLVQQGCLMQVTAGSLLGTFGTRCQRLADSIVLSGRAHFIATDAHGSKARRPLLRRAYQRVTELVNEQLAYELCCRNPELVTEGLDVPVRVSVPAKPKSRWFSLRRAA